MVRNRDVRYWLNLSLFGLASLGLATTLSTICLCYRSAQNYVHPARSPRVPGDNPAKYGIPYHDIELITEDGIRLKAWYTPSYNGSIILAAHGYAEKRNSDVQVFFAQAGYGVVSWDARANGESGGELCTLGYYEKADVRAALDFALRQPGVKHVGGFGQSMGAATMIHAAASFPEIEAVVADSSFLNLEQMANNVLRTNLLRPLIISFAEREAGIRLRNMSPLNDVSDISPRPVFIIHGGNDIYVPFESGPELYAAAGEPRFLWVGQGMQHSQMMWNMPEEYKQRVIGFFDRYFGGE